MSFKIYFDINKPNNILILKNITFKISCPSLSII